MREKMTNLSQQLEDKKKELEEQIFERDWGDNFGTKEFNENKVNILQAEIAILEQAIAEMQKQRQEILEIIDDFEEEVNKSEVRTTEEKKVIFVELKLLRIKLQLNQPKTGQ
jgi:ribonuclease HII